MSKFPILLGKTDAGSQRSIVMAKTFFHFLNPCLIAQFGIALCCIWTSAAAPAPLQNSTSQLEISKASRHTSDTDAYIQSINARLAITSRSVDPFGKAQDPSVKPIQPPTAKSQIDKKASQPSAKPLSEVVKLIRVTTVMPGEGRFLIGTRHISRGDIVPLVVQGRRYQVKVVEVTAERILFRDLGNSEEGELRLDVMPQGMTRGIRGVLAPGMEASKADAPIEIDTPGARP